MINDKLYSMKASSLLFILLIGLIGITGFGQSTTNPGHNSKQGDSVVMQITDTAASSVDVMNLDFAYSDVMVTDDGQTLHYTMYQSGNCQIVMFNPEPDVSPPNNHIKGEKNLSYNNYTTEFANKLFRKPIDGFRQSI